MTPDIFLLGANRFVVAGEKARWVIRGSRLLDRKVLDSLLVDAETAAKSK